MTGAATDDGRLVRTRRDAVVELAITNPGARNALSPAMYADGLQAFAEASTDPTVRAVMLHGADGFFCAGGNLNRLLANRALAPENQRDSVEQLNRWVLAIRTCPKPVIAAVEGAAAGAGFSLALACDLIVAARDTKFVMAYARVGLSPDGGAVAALAAALPPQRVFALCALAEPVSTAELHAAGIVHQSSEPARVLADARALSDRLAQGPTAVYARTKRLLEQAPRRAFAEHLAAERDAFVESLHAEDAGEGIAAFLEKRPPAFKGA